MPAGTGGRGLDRSTTAPRPPSVTDPASGAVASAGGVWSDSERGRSAHWGTISTRGVSRVIKHLHMAMVTQLLHKQIPVRFLLSRGLQFTVIQ